MAAAGIIPAAWKDVKLAERFVHALAAHAKPWACHPMLDPRNDFGGRTLDPAAEVGLFVLIFVTLYRRS